MKKIVWVLACCILVSSCRNSANKESKSNKDTVQAGSQLQGPTANADSLSENWIDSFKDFRMAVYHKDKEKLKGYFNFPLTAEGSSILALCKLTDVETNARNQEIPNPELFYERDFDHCYQQIFDAKFIRAVLKLKSADLYQKHNASTHEFQDPSSPYTLHASYDEESKMLQLNMAFRNNGTDSDGEYVSEGEHNIVYVFDIIDGKKLMFRKIVLAG